MSIDKYKRIIRDRMGKKRYIHSVNVAIESIRLAKLYGGDEVLAEIAGVLHDITKETPKETQLQIINNGGIILDNIEKSSAKLWHSISGMIYVRDVLKIDDKNILNAIRYHTTGRQGMSLLEKIIFVADFTGAERDYDGVDIMREKANTNLDDAIFYGLAFTISDLAKRKKVIHPNTFGAYNEIIVKRSKK